MKSDQFQRLQSSTQHKLLFFGETAAIYVAAFNNSRSLKILLESDVLCFLDDQKKGCVADILFTYTQDYNETLLHIVAKINAPSLRTLLESKLFYQCGEIWQQNSLFYNKNKDGHSVLCTAAKYNADSLELILNHTVFSSLSPSQQEWVLFLDEDRYGYTALDLMSENNGNALQVLLRSITFNKLNKEEQYKLLFRMKCNSGYTTCAVPHIIVLMALKRYWKATHLKD